MKRWSGVGFAFRVGDSAWPKVSAGSLLDTILLSSYGRSGQFCSGAYRSENSPSTISVR